MFCSIIINNYNYGRYLRKAIDSALGQTYAECEVVVVDDGSSDDSIAVIQSYGDQIVPVLKENGGQGSAMNVGFEKSRGDVIFFLDADDWLEPTAAEEVMAAYHAGVSHLYYGLEMKTPEGESLGGFKLELETLDQGPDAWRAVAERGSVNFPPTSANAFSRAAMEQILPMPEADFRIRADVYLLHRAVFYGEVIALERPLGNYLVHGSNHWFKESASPRRKKRLGLSRRNPKQFQKGMNQAKQKFDLLDAGRLARDGQWGPSALERWIRLRWKQLLSAKCLSATHPYSADTVKGLSNDIIEMSSQLGVACLSLRIRLFLTRFLPSSVLSVFLFKK
ncbi:MAG: glycosyltransferase [Opitutae bacterium]|nr:glycosyltransferase [Opitutae bacterium]